MSPFDRAHTISYLPFVETLRCLYRLRDTTSCLSKVAKVFLSKVSLVPHWEWLHLIFTKTCGNRKLKAIDYRSALFAWWLCLIIVDIQTHGQIDTRQKSQILTVTIRQVC